MDPGGKIYTIDEFRCWKVENLDDEGSDENKNEKEGYRVVSPHLIAYMPTLERLKAVEGLGFETTPPPPPPKIIFQKDAIFT